LLKKKKKKTTEISNFYRFFISKIDDRTGFEIILLF
jgi:hypothetical protein